MSAPSIRSPLLLLLLGALPPVLMSVAELGRLHPDEVYQFLEPAYFKAFSYGVMSWEWTQGVRNWCVPGVLAALLKLCEQLHIDDPWARRAVLALPQWLLQWWLLWACWAAMTRRVSVRAAWMSLGAVIFWGVGLNFEGRTMSESYSLPFLIGGLERIDAAITEERFVRRRIALAGACLGFAVVCRYGSLAFMPGIGAVLLASRARTKIGWLLVGALVPIAVLGAVDWWTWGAPFHSLVEYVRFNLLSGKAAAEFGESPWWFFLPLLTLHTPLWVWSGATQLLDRRQTAAYAAWAAAGCYVLAISLSPHKEARFLYPAMGVLLWAGTPVLARLFDHAHTRGLAATSALLLFSLGASLYTRIPETETIVVQRAEQFRAEVRAARDATGLLLVGDGLWGVGGNFYIGKRIPWLTCDFATDGSFVRAMKDRTFNRVVSWGDRTRPALEANGFKLIAKSRDAYTWAR